MAGYATRPQDLAGDAIAFLMTLAFGVQLVIARRPDVTPRSDPAGAIQSAGLHVEEWDIPVVYHRHEERRRASAAICVTLGEMGVVWDGGGVSRFFPP